MCLLLSLGLAYGFRAPEPILKRFTEETPEDNAEASALPNSDWLYIERLLRATVKVTAASNSKQLSQTLHQL
jgi:hypothetical protein